MTTIKTIIIMIITTIAEITTNSKYNNKIKNIFKNKKATLISDVSENLCPQNVPVL